MRSVMCDENLGHVCQGGGLGSRDRRSSNSTYRRDVERKEGRRFSFGNTNAVSFLEKVAAPGSA